MGDDDKNTSPMEWFGETLDDWHEVHDDDGEYSGSDHDVTGGTEHYDESGEYSGFTDDDGNEYDASGNLITNDD